MIGCQAEAGQKLLLAGVEALPGGELTVEPAADGDAVDGGVAGQGGGVVAGFDVAFEEVVFAVPVGSVRQFPVGVEVGELGVAVGAKAVFAGEGALVDEELAAGLLGGDGEVAVVGVEGADGGEVALPGGFVVVPDHAEIFEFGDPVGGEGVVLVGGALSGDEGAEAVAVGVFVVGGDAQVAVFGVEAGGCGEAGAAGCGGDGAVGGPWRGRCVRGRG